MTTTKIRKTSRYNPIQTRLTMEGVEYGDGPPPPAIRKNASEGEITKALKALPVHRWMRFPSGLTEEDHRLAQSSMGSRLYNLRKSCKSQFVTRSSEKDGRYFLTVYRVPETEQAA